MHKPLLGALIAASLIPLTASSAGAAATTTTTRKLIDTPLASVVKTGGQVNLIRLGDNSWQASDNSNCPDGITYGDAKTGKCFSGAGEYTGTQVYTNTCQKHTCSADKVWNPVAKTCIPIVDYGCTHTNNFMTLQEWDGCAALDTPAVGGNRYTAGPCLIDNRDGKTYEVRKFADGKCWMANNLKFGGDYAYYHDTLGQDYDRCAKRLLVRYQTGGMDLAYTGKTAGDAPSNRFWYGSYGDCAYAYDSVDKADSNKYGYLYNWMAAVQSPCGWYNWVSDATNNKVCDPDAREKNVNDSGTHGTQHLQSLCPAGWHIPTGGSDGEFSILADRVSGIASGDNHIANETSIVSNCANSSSSCYVGSGTSRNGGNGSYVLQFFVPGGGFNTVYAGRSNYVGESGATETSNVGLIYQGSGAHYWSSTSRSATYAYYLYVNSSRVRPLGHAPGGGKYSGFSVRCVAD